MEVFIVKSFEIQLSYIDDVKQVADAAKDIDCNIEMVSGQYRVNAKSIIGICILDFTKPITVEVHGTEEQAQAMKEKVRSFVVEQ